MHITKPGEAINPS